MIITFSPINYEAVLQASVEGDVLTLNGEAFDFGPLAEGDVIPGEAINTDWIHQPVTRQDGVIQVTLLAPYTGQGSAAQLHPQPVTVSQGPVPFPSAD